MKVVVATAAVVAAAAIVVALAAQQPGFRRKMLQQHDLSTPGHEAITAIAEFEPGAIAAPHTHPGEEIGYVVEGAVVVEQQVHAPQTVNAGETFFIPAGTVHGATNRGSGVARVLATYVVEKGKPLATPAAHK